MFVHPGVTDASCQNLREGMAIFPLKMDVVGETQTRTTMQELRLTMTGELFVILSVLMRNYNVPKVGHNRDRRARYGILMDELDAINTLPT